ncbi:MAG: RNA methyltransferase [Desulfurococcaceae archaeon]
MKYYFILRGDNEHLAIGELQALLETYGVMKRPICYSMLCVVDSDVFVLEKIRRRAGFVKEIGEFILMDNVYEQARVDEMKSYLRNLGKFWAHHSVLKPIVDKQHILDYLGSLRINHHGIRRGVEARILFTEDKVILGISRYKLRTRASICKGPFQRSIALTPDISRALINLSRIRENEVLIDPFAGTGSVLIEAWFMGIRAIGVDIDWELVHGMRANLDYCGIGDIVILGDSTTLEYINIGGVATDLPYGKGASTHGIEIRHLYGLFIERLSSYLPRGKYASFVIPCWLEDYLDDLLASTELRLRHRYYSYVHGGLTRVINVVVKG